MKHAIENRVQAILQEKVDQGEGAGFSVLVRREGEELLYAQAGYAELEAKKELSRDSIFRLYSMSKPMTSAAVMLLLERGAIDLLDPVSKYLPGFASPKIAKGGELVKAVRVPTLWDLLAMTSGTSYPDQRDEAGRAAEAFFAEDAALMAKGEGLDTVTFCDRLGGLPLAFEPGTEFRYGTSADILGAVVEVVSGKRFGDFLREEIFEPLGMKDTAFYVPEVKRDRLVHTYYLRDGQLEKWDGAHLCVSLPAVPPAFESGGAGLFSTIDDYAAFGQMLLDGGSYKGHRVLKERTVELMTSPQLLPAMRDRFMQDWYGLMGFSYGHLLRVCVDPGAAMSLAVKGEYGWDGWLGTYFAALPKEGMELVLMQNRRIDRDNNDVVRRVRNVVLSAL